MGKVIVLGHKNPDTDSICSSIVMSSIAKHYDLETEPVRLGKVSKETKYALNFAGVEEPRLVEKAEDGQEIILVDHNEAGQSIDNRDNAKILGVIDHHRITEIKTNEPLYYHAKPVGCTSTILFDICQRENIEISETNAKLMLSAIISDTLLLKSPTTTEADKKAIAALEKIAGVKASEYGIEMLKAGTDISDLTGSEIINLDAKIFNEGKGKVAQINTASLDDVFARIDELKEAMENDIKKENLDIFMLIVTDIINSNSRIISLGESKDKVEEAYGKKLEADSTMLLENMVSRKKQFLPPLLEVL